MKAVKSRATHTCSYRKCSLGPIAPGSVYFKQVLARKESSGSTRFVTIKYHVECLRIKQEEEVSSALERPQGRPGGQPKSGGRRPLYLTEAERHQRQVLLNRYNAMRKYYRKKGGVPNDPIKVAALSGRIATLEKSLELLGGVPPHFHNLTSRVNRIHEDKDGDHLDHAETGI